MRVLLDECVPRRLKRELIGHDARTVQEMGWAGKRNGELLAAAAAEFDAFLTVDRNLVPAGPLRIRRGCHCLDCGDEPFRRAASAYPIFAGLIALLAGGAVAYVVFLNDRRTQFEDSIQQHRFEIRKQLLALREGWTNLHGLTLLPDEFDLALRRNYPGLSGAPLLNKVSQDVAFLNEPLARTLAEMPKGKPLGSGSGRVYVWVSHEAVAILAPGLISAAPSSR